MENKYQKLIDKAYEFGVKYEKECTGCAQSSIAAIFDALNITNGDIFKSASGLADGLGLTTDGTCGALIGSSMVIGFLYGRERKDFKDIQKPIKSYTLVKKLHDEYVKNYGSCRCQDVQKKTMGRSYNLWKMEEVKEAFNSGMMENCSKIVGTTAKLATKLILRYGFKPKNID